jgi:predicted regulator of Ras-like GTPase activity (Roadblock/LC7/MglB family)
MSLTPQLVLYPEDHRRILAVAERLVQAANATAVFLVEKNGQMVGEAGELEGIDTISLASLVAGNIAATGGLAKIIGEDEFPVHFHQGKRENVHITVVAERIILVVIFDDRSSLGLVRLRVKKAGQKLTQIFEQVFKKAEVQEESAESPFADITDEDIDNLFSD